MINRNYIFELYARGAGAILRYVESLDQKVVDATERVVTSQTHVVGLMSAELARAKHLIQNLSDQLRKLRQHNYQLIKRIHELESEIARGSQPSVQLDSHNSSLPPSHDLPWQKIKRTKSLRKKSDSKVGGQVGHQGKTLLQVEQPDEVIVHAPDVCSRCRTSLTKATVMTTERRQVFEIVHGTLYVSEHQAQTRQCRRCRTSVKAKFPPGVRAPVQYGASVLSRVIYLHLYQLIPVARTAETMRDLFNCRLSEEGKVELDAKQKERWLRKFNRIIRHAAKLNPLPSAGHKISDAPKKKRTSPTTPHSLIKRFQTQRDDILRFMSDFAVPFDNNGSERDLRMVKLQQKIGGCFRTSDGARTFCRVRSYLSTARKQTYSLLYSLEWVIIGKPVFLLPNKGAAN